MPRPDAPSAPVKRELLVRHLEAWAPAALHRARRATFLHGYADADGGPAAEAALRALAELSDLIRGRSLSMVLLGADTDAVGSRLRALQADLGTPADLAVHAVSGGTDERVAVALKAAGARGAPLLAYLDAGAAGVPPAATLAAVAVGRPADLLLVLGSPAVSASAERGPGSSYLRAVESLRAALEHAGFPLVTATELVSSAESDTQDELLIFATASGKSLESFKNALWAVDEYAGVRYRDPGDPERHLLDISLSPHPGPLRRELVARVAAVGACTVTELRSFTLTGTVYRASDATRVLTALLASGGLTRRPEHGRLAGDVVITPGDALADAGTDAGTAVPETH